jgi:hypothetical protein
LLTCNHTKHKPGASSAVASAEDSASVVASATVATVAGATAAGAAGAAAAVAAAVAAAGAGKQFPPLFYFLLESKPSSVCLNRTITSIIGS